MAAPTAMHLQLTPRSRCDLIDVSQQIAAETAGELARHRKVLYCSHHTTAGFMEQSLCTRLDNNRERLHSLFQLFGQLFPPGADYQHDKLHLRHELSEEQRRSEPRNADSHLTFIGSGLKNCVTYHNRPGTPVYFIDLDGVHEHGVRRRKATVLGYDEDRRVASIQVALPVSHHPIDSVNLCDTRLGLIDQLNDWIRRHGVTHGRIDIAVARDEQHTGLTVNEYETLLMRNDLTRVLNDPLRFMVERGRNLLRNPRSIANRTLGYAKYDLVNVLNEVMDATGISESILERVVARFMALPARRFLRLKRGVSLPVIDTGTGSDGAIVRGQYQSPILIQWRKSAARSRRLDISLIRFS